MTRASGIRVDDGGITLRIREDVPLDLSFDDQRIGSFWSLADTVREGRDRVWTWPTSLGPYLHGVTALVLSVHGTDEEVYRGEVRLGEGHDRIQVVDRRGNPLGLDKSFKLMRLFGSRSSAHLTPLLDSIEEVITALEGAGVRPFLAYGTLLGAVREGSFIGHDSDADLGYVSGHDHPADVMLESFAIQRRLIEAGYRVTRYSGAALKVSVLEGDGTHRGLDVFGGFLRDERLYLMGEVGHRFRSEWLYPLGTAQLEGRSFPVPAVPEHLLEGMYGPTWKVPDPAYRFQTPRSASRRLNGWFRGTRVGREKYWDPYYAQAENRETRPVSHFARWVDEQEEPGTAVVDLGCGTGSDAHALARRGRTMVGLDYCKRAFMPRLRRAAKRDLPATYRFANVSELRSTVATGLWLARTPGVGAVMARHLADATDDFGRRNLLRMARLALAARGGRLYVEMLGRPAPGGNGYGLHPVDAAHFRRAAVAAGGEVVEETWSAVDARPGIEKPDGPLCRMIIAWEPGPRLRPRRDNTDQDEVQ